MTMKKITSLIFVFLIVGLNACQEEDEPITNVEQPDVQWDETQLSTYSKAPFLYEKIDEPYEDYGRIAYRFLKFRNVEDPIEYLAEPSRAVFEKNYEAARQEYEGLTIAEGLDKMQANGLLTDKAYSLYRDFFESFLKKANATQSVEEMWNYLRDYEKQLQNRVDLRGEEEPLLSFSSMFRNYVKLKYEVELLSEEERSVDSPVARTCIFGKRLACWGEALGITVLTGLTAALAVVTGGGAIVAEQILWLKVIQAGAKAAGTAFLKETNRISKENRCRCESAPPPPCAQPTGLQIVAENCSNVFGVRVLGGGADPRYTWTIRNGVLTEFSQGANYVPDKFVWIRQVDVNKSVQISLTEHCRSGSTRFYDLDREFNSYAEARNPYPFVFSGATSVPVGDTETYEIYGIANRIVNLNNSFIFSSNYAGQDIEKGANYIKVRWNIKTSGSGGGYGGGPTATVYGSIKNNCSNRSSHRYINVNVY